ncbi:MAG: DUF1295 domain-containing protein [Bradymonadales bacterium]|nr:DUF1295 domain-containing protein [Bradymonadales bacterium]
MSETTFFYGLLAAWAVVGAITMVLLFFVSAPYGRHMRRGWGASIRSRWGWVIMEAPAPLGFLLLFALGGRHANLPALVFLAMWELHYINRTFLFPFRLRGGNKPMPLSIVATAFSFNLVNVYLQGRHLNTLGPLLSSSWLLDPRFLLGLFLFLVGWLINLQSDSILRNLRKPGESGYRIPQGGLFAWVSCPNYLGEIIEWTGWAIATWSLPGLMFAFWTAANLVPRAHSHHRWYRSQFDDYPDQRRAVIPFLY